MAASGAPFPHADAAGTVSAGLGATGLEELLSAAGAAPLIHNTQPWRYRLLPDRHTIDVRAVPERALRAIDPSGRALHISVGAALFNLRLAAGHLGWETRVRLLPSASERQLLARVGLARIHHPAVGHGPDLFGEIRHRHSSRQPSARRPVTAGVIAELVEAAHIEGAQLAAVDPSETVRVLALTAEAERRTVADPLRSAESRLWSNRHQDDDPFDTMPAVPSRRDSFEGVPTRDFTCPKTDGQRPAEPVETSPLILVLSTAHDRRADWLRAGQAMQHALLLAAAHRVRGSLLHQAMEWPDLRLALRHASREPGHIQMLLRLGHGPVAAVEPRQEAHVTVA